MRMYNYCCANGCEFDNPERVDSDEQFEYCVCPICGSEEYSANVKDDDIR